MKIKRTEKIRELEEQLRILRNMRIAEQNNRS